MFNKFKISFFLQILFIIGVLLLSIIKIEDTDCWMHLSFGRLIWENKALPATEQFVYPSFGMPFSYSSWLFGVIYYLSYLLFSIPGIIILKASTITLAFFILLKDSLRPHKNLIISLLIMMLIVIITRHRFAERPETFMMIFLSFSIFSLNAYLYEKKKYIYWLPVIHMLWANCHSSINIMTVPFGAFIIGGLTHKYLNEKNIKIESVPSGEQIKTIIIVFILSFAASLISPYFIKQYFFGAQFLSDPWFKQEILELQSPEWYIKKWLFIGSGIVILTFLINWRNFSVINLLMIIPFAFLSFTAKRFLLLYAIVAGPIVIRNLSSFLRGKAWDKFTNTKIITAFTILWISGFTLIGIVKGTPFDGGRKIFGIGVEYKHVPEGALQYLDKNGIYGRVFNIYEWGGYIIWRDFPKRTVFVDPRGYLPAGLNEKINLAMGRPYLLDALENKYGFNVVLTGYPEVSTSIENIDMALLHPGWALVYWDDRALVYLRKDGKYKEIASRDIYNFIKPANGLNNLKNILQDKENRVKIIDELKRNIDVTNSQIGKIFLGYSYNEIGEYNKALNVFSELERTDNSRYLLQAYSGIAFSYEKLGDIKKAIEYYEKIMDQQKDAGVLYEIGRLYLELNDMKNSLKYLRKALDKDRDYLPVYPLILDIYRKQENSHEFDKLKKYYDELSARNAAMEYFQNGVNAYLNGRFEEALVEFSKAIEMNPMDAKSYSNMGYIYYDRGDMLNAFIYQKKAIEIDPKLANAHFGIAMIYKKHGDFLNEKKHLEEYLKLEPSGYYSRRAIEEIDILNNFLKKR
ncbi:MAG: tetratricopeptide repeat protein [Nitrospirae bacterium]|nr:tetratricopeptide repeat protein [Nitrospirota bacterium]